MAIKVTVKEAQGWFKRERKQLVFPVLDAAGVPQDIRTWGLIWVLKKNATTLAMLLSKTKSAGKITVEQNTAGGEWNVAVVTIEENDCADVRANVELYQELMRTDVPNVLAYGPVTLMP